MTSKLVIHTNVEETTTTEGTGSLTLTGPTGGKQGFYGACADTDTCWYRLTSPGSTGATDSEWEIGIGTWGTGNILARTSVRYSSNSNNPVDLSAGVKVVEIITPLADSVFTTPYVQRTTTGTALTGAGKYAGYICTTAAGNITVYDNTSAAGTVIVPTTALVLGAYPVFGAGTSGKLDLTTGCHVVLSGAATVLMLVAA